IEGTASRSRTRLRNRWGAEPSATEAISLERVREASGMLPSYPATSRRARTGRRSTCTVEAMLLSLRLKHADERHRVAARLGSVDSVAGHARPDRRVGRDRCAWAIA